MDGVLQLFKPGKSLIQLKMLLPLRPKMLLLFRLNLFFHRSKILSFLNRKMSPRKAMTLSYAVGYLVLIYLELNWTDLTTSPKFRHRFRHQSETKTILVWNGNNVFAKQNCTYTRCEIEITTQSWLYLMANSHLPISWWCPSFQTNATNVNDSYFSRRNLPPALIPYYDMTRLANFFHWTNDVQNRRRYSFTLRPSHPERKRSQDVKRGETIKRKSS